jgi:hypothetical protein
MRILSVDEEYSARAGIVEKDLPESIRRLNPQGTSYAYVYLKAKNARGINREEPTA